MIIICLSLPQLDKATGAALTPIQSIDEARTLLHTVLGCQEVPALCINHNHSIDFRDILEIVLELLRTKERER